MAHYRTGKEATASHTAAAGNPGRRVTLRLDGITHGGEAVGRVDGRAVFVPFGIPGEEAAVEIVEDRGRFARARLIEVLAPSPHRVTPRCPHFGPGRCGGCHWQHIDYSLQLALKARIVGEQLERIGGLKDPPVAPAVGMAEPWGYRNHVELAAAPDGTLAYQAAGTNRPVAVTTCPITHPLTASLVSQEHGAEGWRLPPDLRGGSARVILRAGIVTGQRMLVTAPLAPAQGGAAGERAYVPIAGNAHSMAEAAEPAYLEERVAGRTFRFSPRSFFQVNTAQAQRLAATVLRYAALTGAESVVDCFCGAGVFGILMAARAGRVTGIEEYSLAVADARLNAAGLKNLTILEGRAETIMAGLDEHVDVAVIDPPRQGCAPPVIEALVRLAPRRLVYVSCDPATLARDLAVLAHGGYRLAEATPIDMFPQTYHVETVALLTRA